MILRPLILPALLLAALLVPTKGPAMAAVAAPPLIPAPAAWEPAAGRLEIASLQRIVVVGTDPAARRQAALLAGWWRDVAGRPLPVQDAGPGAAPAGSIVVVLTGSGPDAAPDVPGAVDETGVLDLAPDGVTVTAAAPAGLFRGLQAVRQLGLAAAAGDGTVPAGRARLAPRLRWRGMLLDSGRHLQDVATIERTIDQLALYGFNVLHWHLTEDQGWRLEVPRRPRLTEVGAWRTQPDGTRYGGFYTGDEVRRVVAYAAAHFVTVVPEIELPGHAKAALAAYPGLSCTGGPFAVETRWGIHEDVFCAGSDEVFALLADVFDRVVALFPAAYVHIGGDEVPKDRWRACPRCAQRMAEEGLADVHALQSWFVRRAGALLRDRGRRLIGWDEILEGGLPAGATVQSWRGTAGAVAAAEAGHDAIVSPTSHAYFDYDPGQLPLERVLAFAPVPPGLEGAARERILGGEMNVWTEYVPQERLERHVFPRIAAMAEALGAPAGPKPLDAFLARLRAHRAFWPRLGIRAGAASRPLQTDVAVADGGEAVVRAAVAGPHAELLDGVAEGIETAALPLPAGWRPDGLPEEQFDPAAASWQAGDRWSGPVDTPTLVLARLLVSGPDGGRHPYGAPAAVEMQPSLARGRAVAFTRPPSRRYPGRGERPLTDGARGGRDFADGRWVGFEAADCELTVDLGAVRPLREVSARFIQDANAWIFLPPRVTVWVSDDGAAWREAGAAGHEVSDREQRKVIREFAVAVDGPARFVRLRADSAGPCPDWHPGRGQPSWLFVDELQVR